MIVPTSARPQPWFRVALGVLAGLAAVWAMVGSAWVLPALSANSDEGLYLLQADALASGRLAPEAPRTDADAYLPWFSVARDGRYVLKYSPVHASVLATAERATGSPRPALGLIAAAQVLLVVALARELGAARRAALAGGALFVAAPLAVQLDITYLSYGTSLALLLATATAASRAQRTGSRALALAAGLLGGLALFARPYDAMLFGLALTAALALRHRRVVRPEHPPLVQLLGCLVLGAVLPVGVLLAFNHLMTGDAVRLPFRLLESRDSPGLGLRRARPADSFLDYTVGRALSSFGRNLLLVLAWSAGGVVGCALAIATLVRRRLGGGGVVLAVLIVWPVGYALFWGSYVAAFLWDGALFLGPFYYLPMVAVLAIAAGVAMDDLWRWRPEVGIVAAVAMGVLTMAVVVPRLAEQRDRSEPRTAVAEAVSESVRGRALVFVPPLYGPTLQNPLSFLRNDATLDGDVIYALDRGDRANARVRAAHPDRVVYELVLPFGWSDEPGFDPGVRVVEVPPG